MQPNVTPSHAIKPSKYAGKNSSGLMIAPIIDITAKVTPTISDRCRMVCATGGASRSVLFTRAVPVIAASLSAHPRMGTLLWAALHLNPAPGTEGVRTARFVLAELRLC